MSSNRASLPETSLHSPRRPRKSILKSHSGENNTVPLTSNGRIIDLQIKPHDRRVSFAENVHLREIDPVQYHSETPASGSSEDFENGSNAPSSDIESSDFDEDVSLSELESRADHVLPMIQTANNGSEALSGISAGSANSPDHDRSANFQIDERFFHNQDLENSVHMAPANDSATEEDSDVAMDFTGPISRIIPQLREDDREHLQEDADYGVAPTQSGNGENEEVPVPANELNSSHADPETFLETLAPAGNHKSQSFALAPEHPEHPDGTPLAPSASYANEPNSGDPEYEFHHMNSFAHPMENGNIAQTSNYAPSLTSSEDLDDGEEEMQFTQQMQVQAAYYGPEEVTMDLTVPQVPNLAVASSKETVQEYHSGTLEMTLDFSAALKPSLDDDNTDLQPGLTTTGDLPEDLNSQPDADQEEASGDEVTMEFTKPVKTPPSVREQTIPEEDEKDKDAEDEEEVTMDFTKHVEPEKSPSNGDSVHKAMAPQVTSTNDTVTDVPEDEEEAMELTQTVGSRVSESKVANSETVAKSAETVEHENELEKPAKSEVPESNPARMSPIYVESQDPAENPEPPKQDSKVSPEPPSSHTNRPEETPLEESRSRFGEPAAESVQTPTNLDLSEDEGAPFRSRNADYVPARQTSRNSSTSSSSSEINVFGPDLDDDNVAGKRRLGPAMNPSPPKRQKLQPSEISHTHLTVTKASEPQYNEQWDVPNVSLPEFLDKIGVTFYDDLAISTDISAGRAPAPSPVKRSKEDYFRANVELPILHLYELNCQQLAQKIKEGQESFEEGKRDCMQENPPLFKRFLSASPSEQAKMQTSMHSMKEYSKQRARQIWYAWRNDVIRDITGVYQNNLAALEKDKELLASNMKHLDRSYAAVQRDVYTLRLDLQKFKELQATSAAVKVEDIQNLKNEMVVLNENLIRQKKAISEKEKAIATLRTRVAERNEEVAHLKNQVSRAEEELNKTKRFNSAEIKELQVVSSIMQACTGLKYIGDGDNIYEFELDSRIRIALDSTKLDTPDGLVCRVLQTGKTYILNEELLGLVTLAFEKKAYPRLQTALDKLKFLRDFWRKLQVIDREIFRISIRYSVRIHDITSNALGFSFEYLSISGKLKIEFSVSIPVDKVASYPAGVEVQSRLLREDGARDESVRGTLSEIGEKLLMFTQIQQPVGKISMKIKKSESTLQFGLPE